MEREVDRRGVLAFLAGAGALALTGCTDTGSPAGPGGPGGPSGPGGSPLTAKPAANPTKPPSVSGTLIGDGSTMDTGPQPHQPVPKPLGAGKTPKQFVVISWDGAADTASLQLTRFLDISARFGGSMTLFLSGLFLLPEGKRNLYHPPGRPVGSSEIPFLNPTSLRRTITSIRRAWLEGHEIGTHFNGHFCGPNGVGRWTPAQWRSEIDQAVQFVTTWRTTTGFTDLAPFPFDYRKELVGSRTPCLEGRTGLLPTAHDLKWRYDSSWGRTQKWPERNQFGMWDLSMPSIPFPGQSREVLAMDYNFMTVQNGGKTRGAAAAYPGWRDQVVAAYQSAFDRAYNGNRAPLVIGNHFEQWCGGIYMDAVETVMLRWSKLPEVQFISMRQLCDWLDAQDPALMGRLQRLPVGTAPRQGWKSL